MDTKECILTRRSVRKFDNKQIQKDTIEEIIKETSFAPSWKNSQTVSFIAIENQEIKNQIAKNCTYNFEWNSNIIKNAPLLMLVITKNNISGYEEDGKPTTSKGSHWQSFDAGLATQTLCLSAHNKNIGSVILGIYDEDAIRKLLNISSDKSISALVAMGYHNSKLNAPIRKKIEEILEII